MLSATALLTVSATSEPQIANFQSKLTLLTFTFSCKYFNNRTINGNSSTEKCPTVV